MANAKTEVYEDKNQFLRFSEVTIKNFKREDKIVIGNEFEMEFNYFKTLDQTKEDDSGSVTVYGLTDETIALLEEEGGEIWFKCGYELGVIENLFIAQISRVHTKRDRNITATTIECSANLLTHFYAGFSAYSEDTVVPLIMLLKNLGTSLGYAQTSFNVDNVPKEHVEKIVRFINTYKVTNYNIGDFRTVLEQLCEMYRLTFQRVLIDGEDTAVFAFSDLGLRVALRIIEKGYKAVDLNDANFQSNFTDFAATLSAPEDINNGVFLNKDTGLIESEAEYQLITSFLEQKLNANERETAESEYKRNNPEEPKKKKKGLEEEESLVPESGQNSTPNGGDNQNPFVSNSTLSNLKIKPNLIPNTNIVEATGGGQVRADTARFATLTQAVIGSNLIYFSAFNDHYHKVKSPNSLHTQGKAFDFTVKSGKSGAPITANAVRKLANSEGYRVKVTDEYNFPSSKATAGHIHVEVLGRSSVTQEVASPPTDFSGGDTSDNQGDYYGRTPIEISRRYNRIKALLNPLVIPQSFVFTEDKDSDDLLIHRVRHATYTGNNKRGDWTMLLYCEDTESKNFKGLNTKTTPTSEELASERLD